MARKLFINLDAPIASSLVDGVASNFQASVSPFPRDAVDGVEFHFLRRNPDGATLPFRYVDPGTWTVKMQVGLIGGTPSGGVWKYTDSTAVQTSAEIEFDATAAEVQAAIRLGCPTNFANCEVTGDDGGPYLIDRVTVGTHGGPAFTAEGLEPFGSGIVATIAREGTATLSAQYFLELVRASPITLEGAEGDGLEEIASTGIAVGTVQAGGTGANKVFSLAWDAAHYAGDVTLSFEGDTVTELVGPIAYNATAEAVAADFATHTDAAGNEVVVVKNGPGNYSITCTGPELGESDTPELSVASNTLQAPIGLTGVPTATAYGISSLLNGAESAECTLEIWVDDGVSSAPVVAVPVTVLANLIRSLS